MPLAATGLGGVAANAKYVIISDRELNDTIDAWKCFHAASGQPAWSVRQPAAGLLDYGNSPRATPVIADGLVYLFGAFGNLTCVKLETGAVVWETNTADEYEPAEKPKWGTCSTPLLIDGKLIANPGAKEASLVAFDAKTGKVLWKTPGKAAGYGSLIAMPVDGKMQIVGHDAVSLGGWDPATGQRLWSLVPEKGGDFNVPTPIALQNQLLVSTENNGTRLYDFKDGKIVPKPVAVNRKLAPDTHSPVVTAGRVFGLWRRLYCLDLKAGLKEIWNMDKQEFSKYGTIVADDHRVLVIDMTGSMTLLDAVADEYTEIGRLKALDGESGLYSHPAFVDGTVYLRSSNALVAVKF